MSCKIHLIFGRCLRFDDLETWAERQKIDKLASIHTTFELFLKNMNTK